MKTLLKRLVGLVLLVCSSVAAAQTTLASCRLGKNQHETVSVVAGQPIADSQVISLKIGPDAPPHPIFGGENDASRGSKVKIRCVGKEEKVLLLVGEFLGSGYPRGIAVRFHERRIEQIEFAEPGLPAFVDLTPSEMRLAFSRHGPEIAAQFVIYTYVTGAGPMSDVKAAHRVPRPADGVRIPVGP